MVLHQPLPLSGLFDLPQGGLDGGPFRPAALTADQGVGGGFQEHVDQIAHAEAVGGVAKRQVVSRGSGYITGLEKMDTLDLVLHQQKLRPAAEGQSLQDLKWGGAVAG